MAQAVTAVAASILLVCAVWLWAVASAAKATGPIPLWETAAVSSQTAPVAASEERLAMWIVEDLSRKNGHD